MEKNGKHQKTRFNNVGYSGFFSFFEVFQDDRFDFLFEDIVPYDAVVWMVGFAVGR